MENQEQNSINRRDLLKISVAAGITLAAAVHIGLLWLVHLRPEMIVPLGATVLVVGVAGSHMPGNIRHWSFVHGRRID